MTIEPARKSSSRKQLGEEVPVEKIIERLVERHEQVLQDLDLLNGRVEMLITRSS